jgi:uncharacterized membrane protein YdjX (TVP38/TMEM64 family)
VTKVQENGSESPPAQPRGQLWRILPLVVVLGLAALVVLTGSHRALTLETVVRHRDAIQAFIATHGLVAPALYMAIYIVAVALSVPGGTALTIIGGILFGTLVGGVSAIAGATVGAALLFLIARTAFGEGLARRAGPLVSRLAEGFREDAFNYLLFLRLVPIFPFWLINLAPALLGVPLKTFVTATAIGVIPGAFAFAFFGSGLDSVIEGQKGAFMDCVGAGRADCKLDFDLKAAFTPKLIAAFLILGLVALVPVVVKRIKARRRGA